MSRKRIEQVAAAGGIAFVVLESVGQGLIQVGGAEPSFRAPAEEIMAFFLARDDTLFNWGGYLSLLSFITLIWFLAALWAAIRRTEGDPALLAMVAFGSGLVGIASVTGGGWAMAIFRIREGLDPQLGRMLFDLGNFAFATSWIFFASLLLAAGLAGIQYRALPRWLGWASIIVAFGLLVGRIIWTSPAAFVPWVLFWLWLLIISVTMIRRAGRDPIGTAAASQEGVSL